MNKIVSNIENNASFKQLGPQIPYNYDVNLLNTGYEKCDPLHYAGPLRKSCYILHVVMSGKGIYRVNGVTHHLARGDMFFITPEDTVFYQADRNDPWEYRWVRFDGKSVPLIFEGTGILSKRVFHMDGDQFAKTVEHMESIYRCFENEFDMYLSAMGQFYLFISWFIKSFREKKSGTYKLNLMKVISFIDQNYTKELDMDMISRSIGYNRSHIYKLFIKHLNCSPKEYIESLRMNLANEMLYETTMSIKDIANSVGYVNYASFIKIYRQRYGMTPTEYREKYCYDKNKEEDNGKDC